MGGNEGANALKFHWMKNVGSLHKSNENILDYLSSDFGREVLSKNKKIHLDSGSIYYSYLNMKESIYDFMTAQQDEKKFVDCNLDIKHDLDFYLNEVIIGTTDDKFNIDIHSTSKFLFYHFNNLKRDFGEGDIK